MMERIRVASLQYFIRPVQTFEQFRDQVSALVDTAVDYKCHLIVFPEYSSVQLLGRDSTDHGTFRNHNPEGRALYGQRS